MADDNLKNELNLARLISEKGVLDTVQAVGVMLNLVRAVGELHNQGKIHRQIGPETLVFDQEMLPNLPSPAPLVTLGGHKADPSLCPPQLKNQPLSLPPEIEAVQKILTDADILLDPRQIDFYQLGAVLCFMVTGKKVSTYLRSVKARASVPVEIRPVLDCALGFNSKANFKTCEAFAAELQTILDNLKTGETSRDREGAGIPFDHLGHYKIIERIGRGGMGDVYKGYEEALDRFVAVKVLPAEMGQQADFIQRFHTEAAAIAKLDHPNVIRIYYTGEDQGRHFFAMQYVEGQPLSELLARRKKLSPGEMLPIVEQCLAGLGAVHQLGLVHRDVKPGNILLDQKTNRVLVTDFGLVKLAQAKNQMTVTGMVMGTADYIAPEQARGQEIDHRADLYAVGVLMYQILSGRLPFKADTPTAMMFQHAYEPPPPLETLAPEIPAPLVQIVMKLLAKEPADRYPSAQAVIDDLEKAVSQPLSDSSHTTIIKAPASDGIPAFPAGLFKPLSSGWLSKILNFFRREKKFHLLNTTSCQMDGAILEYERQREQLQSLADEAQAAADDLKLQIQTHARAARKADLRLPQTKSLEEKQQILRDRQESEQTVAELSQMLAEQQEQAEQIDLNLKQLDAALVQLRSQRNTLNARLNAANANLKMDGGGPPSLWRSWKPAFALIPILFLGFLFFWWLGKPFEILPEKDSSLVACWKFEEGEGNIVHDTAGKNHGTIHGATWAKGISGHGLKFDGLKDYVSFAKPVITTKEFSISAWARMDGRGGGVERSNPIFSQRSDPAGDNRCNIYLAAEANSEARSFALIRSNRGSGQELSCPRPKAGEWHHYVLAVHSKEIIFYIDGLQVGQTPNLQSGDYASAIDYTFIGKHRYDRMDAGFFNGIIDEVAIFDRAISTDEVQQLYQIRHQPPKYYPSPKSDWTVLFRSDDPAIWDTNTNDSESHFAVPLKGVSSTIRWLRLKRMDNGEVVIIPMRLEYLRATVNLDDTYVWNGTSQIETRTTKNSNRLCVNRRLGIANRKMFTTYHSGQTYIIPSPKTTKFGWSGWGFGRFSLVYSYQSYSWAGQTIDKTVFEIAVKSKPLTDIEKQYLLTPTFQPKPDINSLIPEQKPQSSRPWTVTDQDPSLDFLDEIESDVPFTDWMTLSQIDQHFIAIKDKGLWFTGVEGRWHEGVPQFRFREEPVLTRAHEWFWWFNQDAPSMNKQIHEYSDQGFRLVYFQSFRWPDGTKRYQGIWQKVE